MTTIGEEVMEVKLSVHVLFSVCYHLIVDKYWGYLYRIRWCRLNPRLRKSSSPL